MKRLGIIGGSGLYNLEGVNKIQEVIVDTPYGCPSDSFFLCELNNKEIVFLPRHGRNHQISPSAINYRANIYGMKKMLVSKIISISACGSLKEEYRPLDFVIPDQFVDRTNQARKCTFFDEGVVAHIGFANPICKNLSSRLIKSAKKFEVIVHEGGTYVNMEGPQFSTKAESNLYRNWGMDIIGMTNMTEARLAREAEMCYVTLAAVTDYDCWHDSHDSVTLEMILSNLANNITNSKKILKDFIVNVDCQTECDCNIALKDAIITRSEFISQETRERLDLIIGRYIK